MRAHVALARDNNDDQTQQKHSEGHADCSHYHYSITQPLRAFYAPFGHIAHHRFKLVQSVVERDNHTRGGVKLLLLDGLDEESNVHANYFNVVDTA